MHVVILGNGITGASAAVRLRELRPDWQITMISGESAHPYSRPALMYVFIGHMRYQDTKLQEDSFWPKQRIDLVRDWAVELDAPAKRLRLHRGGELTFDRLLLATGSKPNRFDWPGQDLRGVQGLYGLMDLKLLHDNCEGARQAVIVGGGLIGIELAEMLHSRGIHPTLLVREPAYWSNVLPEDEARMVGRAIDAAGIGLRLESELAEIVDDGTGRAGAIVTKAGERLEAQIVGLTAGVSPNLDLVGDTQIECERGVLVDDGLRTSAEDIWAAGDCAEIRREGDERNLLQQVWYTGRLQGRLVAESIAADSRAAGAAPSYDPGLWYNSAKFLDLEYQTYGEVRPGGRGQESLWWQHESRQMGMRIALAEGDRVAGFNVVGLRYRHEVCRRWLSEGRGLDYVLDHLGEANFDPEFEPRFEPTMATSMRGARP
ncbi:NAD(P)/FAD-dependent oxidoreductase [Engelhardtia mirabilis]|uniref:NAD(P)/FAD-dependent oxidoreductase n=1 Tax=Engelhardtia mirabilis TaxID=2528011 RepID=UPI003AF3600A